MKGGIVAEMGPKKHVFQAGAPDATTIAATRIAILAILAVRRIAVRRIGGRRWRRGGLRRRRFRRLDRLRPVFDREMRRQMRIAVNDRQGTRFRLALRRRSPLAGCRLLSLCRRSLAVG
jgi:hypothetical protein